MLCQYPWNRILIQSKVLQIIFTLYDGILCAVDDKLDEHFYCWIFVHYITLTQACCQDPRCQRLKLTDLLVAPLQHCTKLPLLLSNIRKYTGAEDEVEKLTESIARVETSLRVYFLFIDVTLILCSDQSLTQTKCLEPNKTIDTDILHKPHV